MTFTSQMPALPEDMIHSAEEALSQKLYETAQWLASLILFNNEQYPSLDVVDDSKRRMRALEIYADALRGKGELRRAMVSRKT